MKIGIVGLGFVGNAMYQSFLKKGLENDLNIYDKFKNGGVGTFESILDSDILFLALPTPYHDIKKQYEYGPIEETLNKLKRVDYQGIIIIKSTVTPETTFKLEEKYKLGLIHNPEFLTARTAEEDFHLQTHIVLGKGKLVSYENYQKVILFYQKHYPNAHISLGSSLESESMKIYCNSFYALKVQFFTELYQLCKKNNSDYTIIKNMMLKNNWINSMHTNVPGPDGLLSYGGFCFPKDTNALNEYMKSYKSENKVLDACIVERNEMREDHTNCIKEKL
ncbi:putative UDP-glucose 6-dehydrogenase [Cafeteria roenbergensis virus]|uniref:Putative UDP-glucose 6-dehydrogenase n=1 Tax=Cafeteria roenbergensis virus (strain BV-PW1) TaxID=693272 RepID=E3T512_CROVB|nr:UDP-glucose dehydrogenase [Cafeteria roenbergensis virus BV-PW1]ADO67275.1 putative UDP-glucose 6-dehydrogenase [Cafeteria roenbergensis virus BV-PW1]